MSSIERRTAGSSGLTKLIPPRITRKENLYLLPQSMLSCLSYSWYSCDSWRNRLLGVPQSLVAVAVVIGIPVRVGVVSPLNRAVPTRVGVIKGPRNSIAAGVGVVTTQSSMIIATIPAIVMVAPTITSVMVGVAIPRLSTRRGGQTDHGRDEGCKKQASVHRCSPLPVRGR